MPVEPWNTLIPATGTLSSSARICAIEVSCPWPELEETLAEEIRLIAPWRAEGADRGLVRHDADYLALKVADSVRSEQELRRLRRNYAAVRAHIGAHVGDQPRAHAEDVPLGGERDLE